jgi:hypothetical protein
MEALPHSGQNTPQVPLFRTRFLRSNVAKVHRPYEQPADGPSEVVPTRAEWRRSLADGITKRQIAERPLISERTADGHPEHPSSVAAAGRRSPAGS